MSDLATALALVLVIEGCLWALLPDGMRRAAASLLETPKHALQVGGLALAAAGVGALWLIRG